MKITWHKERFGNGAGLGVAASIANPLTPGVPLLRFAVRIYNSKGPKAEASAVRHAQRQLGKQIEQFQLSALKHGALDGKVTFDTWAGEDDQD